DPRPAAANGDEDPLVQPVELARRGLDSRRRAERVLARVGVLTTSESLEDLGAAVPDGNSIRSHSPSSTPASSSPTIAAIRGRNASTRLGVNARFASAL